MNSVKSIKILLKNLHEIALKAVAIEGDDIFNQMIENEKNGFKEGYLDRIFQINRIKKVYSMYEKASR